MSTRLRLIMVIAVVLALLIPVSLLFAGSEKKSAPPPEEKPAPAMEEEKPPIEVKPLVIGTTDKLTGSIDSAQAYDFHTWEIFWNMSSGLLNYKPGTTDLVPGLAAEWPAVSPDGLEYTFKLRKGLKFSDGTPFDAKVVKYSIDRVFKTRGDPAWLVTSFVKEVQVVDDYTVKFILNDAYGYFPSLVATPPYFPVSPKVYPIDKIVDQPDVFPCIGPYIVKSLTRDVEIVMEANPDYYGPAPKEKEVIIKYFADATTMRLALENKEIDIAWKTLNPADIEDLKTKPNLKTIEVAGAYIRYLCFVTDTPPTDNELVRQGISYAIDRKAVAEKVFFNQVLPLYSMIPIGMWSHIDAFGEYNPQKAVEILAKAGYSKSNPLEVPLWWTPTHYGDTEQDVASVLKTSMEKTGVIKVTLQSAEWATYINNFDLHNMLMFLLGWYPDYIDPDDYSSPWAHSGDASNGMGIFLNDPKMDQLLDKAATTSDQPSREKVYKDVQEYWTKSCPTVPIFQGKLFLVVQPNVEGIMVGATMIFNYRTVYRK
jgi:peptide/nickel transport system substrate-binding protein